MSDCNDLASPVPVVAVSLKRGLREVEVATGGVGTTRLARLKTASEERLKAERDFERDFCG